MRDLQLGIDCILHPANRRNKVSGWAEVLRAALWMISVSGCQVPEVLVLASKDPVTHFTASQSPLLS